MELTGKALDKFEDWFNNKYDNVNTSEVIFLLTEFNELEDNMKFGVLVDFFESEGMQVYLNPLPDGRWSVYIDNYGSHTLTDYILKHGRPEARTAAVEKANEILNQKLDK